MVPTEDQIRQWKQMTQSRLFAQTLSYPDTSKPWPAITVRNEHIPQKQYVLCSGKVNGICRGLWWIEWRILGRCGGEAEENYWIRANVRKDLQGKGNLWKCNQVCLFVLKRSAHTLDANTPKSAKQVMCMHTNARNVEHNHAWRIYMINKHTSCTLVPRNLVSLTWEV